MEGLMIRGRDLIVSGRAGPANRRLRFSNKPEWNWGFRTVRGGVDPGGRPFRPRFVGFVEVWKD